jgi:uroporphyrinogen-III synthase
MAALRILSTKKLAVNQKQFLLNAGLAVIEADFISIHTKPFEPDVVHPNLIFTSQNAFRSFLANTESSRFSNRNIFCVGSKTKEVIERYGFKIVAVADYATLLADLICKEYSSESFTFFSGSLRRDTLPEALANAQITFNEVMVYETVLSPHKIIADVNGILFFSPSGVESYLKENVITRQTCFCIGTTTAEALKDKNCTIVVADKPTVENVIVKAVKYYAKTRGEGIRFLKD